MPLVDFINQPDEVQVLSLTPFFQQQNAAPERANANSVQLL